MSNQYQNKRIRATLAAVALLAAPAYSKGWSSMEEQRDYLFQDETVAVLAKQQPQSSESVEVPFNAPVDSKAEEAGLSLQLQLSEMVAVGRLWASDLLGRLTDGVAALSPLSKANES